MEERQGPGMVVVVVLLLLLLLLSYARHLVRLSGMSVCMNLNGGSVFAHFPSPPETLHSCVWSCLRPSGKFRPVAMSKARLECEGDRSRRGMRLR